MQKCIMHTVIKYNNHHNLETGYCRMMVVYSCHMVGQDVQLTDVVQYQLRVVESYC